MFNFLSLFCLYLAAFPSDWAIYFFNCSQYNLSYMCLIILFACIFSTLLIWLKFVKKFALGSKLISISYFLCLFGLFLFFWHFLISIIFNYIDYTYLYYLFDLILIIFHFFLQVPELCMKETSWWIYEILQVLGHHRRTSPPSRTQWSRAVQ